MSDEESKLSAYMTCHSAVSRNYSLFAGFTFTAMTILITRLPDPSTWQSQAMLLFLATLFHLQLVYLNDNERLLAYCVRFAPKLPQNYLRGQLKRWSWQGLLIWLMLASSVWLLFPLWSRLYLALATGIMSALCVVWGIRRARIPFKDFKALQRINLHEAEN